MWEQGDGTVRVAASLDGEGRRILARAVEAYATVTGSGDQRPTTQRWADALVEIGRVALDHLDPTRAATITRAGRRPHLTLLTDTRHAGSTATGAGQVVLGGAGYLGPTVLDPQAAGWLGCRADRQTATVDDAGRVVGLGDVDRRMPGLALRREIALRDLGCRWPGCTRPGPPLPAAPRDLPR